MSKKSSKYEIDSESENEIVEEELSEAEDFVGPEFVIADKFSSLKAISRNEITNQKHSINDSSEDEGE